MSQPRTPLAFWIIFPLCLAAAIAVAWAIFAPVSAVGASPRGEAAVEWLLAGELPQGLAGAAVIGTNTYLTAIGGQVGSNAPVADVRTVALLPDGGLGGGWNTSAMPAARSMHGAESLEGYVYVFGGSGPAVLDSALSSPLDGSGAPLNWRAVSGLPAARTLAGTAIYGRHLYLAGGWGADSQAHQEVYFAEVGADGSLNPWQNATPLPAPRSNLALVAAAGYLYAVGGNDGAATGGNVWRARINGDGALSAWEELPPLPQPRMDHAVVYYRNNLVVLGGSAGGATDTVFSAPVLANGGLGPWETNALLPALPLPLDRHAVVTASPSACGEVLYIVGGRSNGAYQRSVWRSSCPPTPPPTITPSPTPTSTPLGPWATWRGGTMGTFRPGEVRTVILDFGSQTAPTVIHAVLFGPAVFADSGYQDYQISLPLISGAFPISIRVNSDAHVGDVFYLNASVNSRAVAPYTGRIGRGVYLPLLGKDYWVSDVTVTPSPTSWRPPTSTLTPSLAPSLTPSPSATPQTPTWTPTPTATQSITPTSTRTFTPTPTRTRTFTPTATRTYTPTPTTGPRWVTIKSENFEGSWPGSWQLSDQGTSPYYYFWGKRNCRPYAGSYSGWGPGGQDGASLSCGANYPNDVVAWMTYGPFSLSDALAGDMSYYVWRNFYDSNDKVFAGVSTNGSNFYGTSYSGSYSWSAYTLDFANVYTLGNILGQPQVWVAFVFISDGAGSTAEGGYVDNINVRKQVSGSVPPASPPQLPTGAVYEEWTRPRP